MEWDHPEFDTYIVSFYSRSAAWLEKSEFESGPYQHSKEDDDWNESKRLSDNRFTRTFNLVCGTNFKTRQ